jgi:hypothetical protein
MLQAIKALACRTLCCHKIEQQSAVGPGRKRLSAIRRHFAGISLVATILSTAGTCQAFQVVNLGYFLSR